MKRSSGIIVTGLSATLLSTGAVLGTGFLSPDTETTTAASQDGTAASQDTSTAAAQNSTTATESAPTPSATADASTDTSADAAGSAASTFDGEAVTSRYGTFQAEITVEDGQITAIDWLQSGEADHHSQQINEYAMPVLEQAILEAQSVDVGYVSGASYTSDAVEQAVYSAMQVAGLA